MRLYEEEKEEKKDRIRKEGRRDGTDISRGGGEQSKRREEKEEKNGIGGRGVEGCD